MFPGSFAVFPGKISIPPGGGLGVNRTSTRSAVSLRQPSTMTPQFLLISPGTTSIKPPHSSLAVNCGVGGVSTGCLVSQMTTR